MKTFLGFLLQFSHVIFFYAAYNAWKKRYYLFSCVLLGLLVISIATHHLEEIYNYNDNTFIEWFEKAYALTTLILSIIIFRKFFTPDVFCLFFISIVIYLLSRNMYLTSHKHYLVYHTIWHIGSGFALLRLIENAKVNNGN
jgi:hypothetical protein